eukprot:CAMPEP_0169316180 /NCGR_PEP_ID=MMETSP1017-20121227/6035_1 /TAXON_ID=342587 /ORGANISM="Karlodinium micrum, Strain CCMP2283" /LENGTH=59 /DNA_ID=CAMNT_0009410211 /DNA_START=19 /DNA_END=202 /DNA_ORIENTATION=-
MTGVLQSSMASKRPGPRERHEEANVAFSTKASAIDSGRKSERWKERSPEILVGKAAKDL